ncbi:hypothetical protein OH76DRAFT_83145 [Lentinus brumalis]|uniref:Uncharacterized protein n=1 Tax=Lentinus brumalis TaxID=2498619 RepID=A0A371DL47_9APHY|nr:hypothetical protein OH76DRAFT_83145 [Polyporus brumalis]
MEACVLHPAAVPRAAALACKPPVPFHDIPDRRQLAACYSTATHQRHRSVRWYGESRRDTGVGALCAISVDEAERQRKIAVIAQPKKHTLGKARLTCIGWLIGSITRYLQPAVATILYGFRNAGSVWYIIPCSHH